MSDFPAVPGSLEERIEAERDVLETRSVERFRVPGLEHLFEVDLQVLGWKRIRSIAEKHARVHDPAEKELRVAADTILRATVAFHAVGEEGATEEVPGMTWMRLARARDKALAPEANERAGLIRLLGGKNPAVGGNRIVFMYGEYMDWLKTGNTLIDRELARGS